jgi:hypothetical protein
MPRFRPTEQTPKLPEVPHVTMQIKSATKRGIVVSACTPDGTVSYTMVDEQGEWCGDGRIKIGHYTPESMQFIWGFLDYNCPESEVISHDVSTSLPSSRRARDQ